LAISLISIKKLANFNTFKLFYYQKLEITVILLIRRKKEIKRLFFTTLIIATICLSNVQILHNFIVLDNENVNNKYVENLLEEPLLSSNRNIDDNFTGSGVDQDIRIYVNNQSENLQNNEGYFEIPSDPTEDMFLTYGNFNFTFQNNFTTNYVIENDDALYADDFIAFDYNTGYSSFNINSNHTYLDGGYSRLIDNNNGSYITVDAPDGVLNFTIFANFTDTTYTSDVIHGNVEFNRTQILALISSLVLSIDSSENVNLTVSIRDFSDSTWKELISKHLFNGSLGIQKLKDRFINENLNFIDLDNGCEIQFVLERGNSFVAHLYEYDLQSVYTFDLPVTNQSYVALEFDLKGVESAVNGFYAWIRTLDLNEVATTKLNITLYRANRTVVRTDTNLRTIKLGPNYDDMIDSVIVNAYSGDNLSYFKFNSGNTSKLNLSNYFIVIKSNNSKEVYSLVTLPWFSYGDTKTEHQLKTTIDDGNTWINAKKVVETDYRTYTSGQLDASSFMLNVTRGYMPSDFIVNDNYTLRIQDLPLANLVIDTFPFNESSFLIWGLGQWKYNFSTPIEDNPSNNFKVDLTWNKTLIKGFKFNITYSVNAYWIENATTSYTAKYNNDPEWLYTFDFDIDNPLFNNWDFFEFWFTFPDFLISHNVTNPNDEKILPYNATQTTLSDNPSKDKIVIPSNLATQSGLYILNLTSYNFISTIHSYINFKGLLWESNGFMNGDNISISANIQDPNSNPPLSGDMNAILFYPNGTQFRELNSSIGLIQQSGLFYNFDNQTILDLTNDLTIFGKYHLGFFWFNGSAIGCKKLTVFIDTYEIVLYDCKYYSQIRTNVLDGEIKNKVFQNYTALIASINETTGISMPNFYPINNSDVDSQFSYEMGGQELPILLTSFRQSENILNPNETVNINVALQNLHPFIPVDVKIDVKLVSYINEDWVIAENTSDSALLYFSGHPQESHEFSVDLKIPDLDAATNIWAGANAPIRLGGAKTIVTIYIDDFVIGEFKSTDYSLLSNETSNNFEGYILGLRVAEETTIRSILYDFERDECLYFPKNSTFLVNIIDQNYISSYEQFIGKFSLKLNSQFTNISINPNNPIKDLSFNLSSILTTEFGEELSEKNITCQYFDNNDNWINIGSDITNPDGFTAFLINTQPLDFKGDLLLRLIWDGDSINGVSKNITVNVIHESDNLSISIISLDVLIYRGKDTELRVFLTNTGNSTLRITNISIELNYEFYNSIVEIDYLVLERFSPGESTNFIVEMLVGYISNFEISISITAQNIITNKSIISLKEASFQTYSPLIYDYFIEFFFVIIISILALVWLVAFFYARRIKKQIETPIEEPIRRKPRKQRYVPVSELKKPTPIKKPLKKKEATKEVEEEKVDLDSLLEERGLIDKKKKPKE